MSNDTETTHMGPVLTWHDIAAALVVAACVATFYVAAVILGVSL